MKRIFIMLIFLIMVSGVYAKEIAVPYTIADRDRAVRSEVKLEEMDKRITDLRADVNARFDDMGKKIDMLAYIFTALVVGVFGFAIWDRKTTVKPVQDKTA